MALVWPIAIYHKTSTYCQIGHCLFSSPFVVSDVQQELVFNNYVGEVLPFDHTSGLASSSSRRRRHRKPLAAFGDACRRQASLGHLLSHRWPDGPCWGSPGLSATDDIPLLASPDCEITSLWSLCCLQLRLVLVVHSHVPPVVAALPLAPQKVPPSLVLARLCHLNSTAWPHFHFYFFISQS